MPDERTGARLPEDTVLYDTHMHTPLCKHAEGEPEEYAAAALQRGLHGVVITCHNPMPEAYGRKWRMEPEDLATYHSIVERARQRFAGTVDVRLGLECDYFPGYEPYLERQLADLELDYVLCSIHPFLPPWKERFGHLSPLDRQKTYFSQLADAAETGLFDCLSHPDLIKNEFAGDWRVEPVLDHVRACLDRIAETGIAMELNTSGVGKRYPEMNPGPEILAEMRLREIPVIVGSDSHRPDRVGDGFDVALALIAEAGYEAVSLVLERQRREIPIVAARVIAGGPAEPVAPLS